jgi:outer membrane receptor protein involved in Fe transport
LVKDQILLVTQGPTSAMRQNVGQARSIGADFEVNSRVNDRLFVRLGYSYVDSIVTSFPGNPSREGLRIPTVSRHQVIAAVTVGDISSLQFTLQGRYLSRQFADDLNRQAIADFVLLDASLRRRIVPQAELFITGENLTDRQYIATQTGAIKTLGQPLLVLAGLKVDL